MRTYLYPLAPALCWLVGCLASPTLAQAQRGGGDSGGSSGGWSRSGDSGGSWDRGGRSESSWRGSSSRSGSDRGGGGDRGGFNPAEMLKRFDRNGNNMIDPEEAQGPAQFFLQRLAQNNPSIDLTKPVPIDKLVGEMDRMRGGSSSSSGGDAESQASKLPELLVPDFSLKTVIEPLPGFGAGSTLFNIKVEERDTKEAEDRIRRYDSNKDGLLDAEELKRGRWSDDPMQYDRNRDGKLSKSELAVRYAQRRVTEQAAQQSQQGQRNDSRSGRGGDSRGWTRSDNRPEEEAKEPVSRFGDAKSYRSTTSASSKTSGLPDFFARSDVNADGQVTMNEFSSSWDAETLAEFQKWDLNGDGVILPSECIAALAGGARVSGMTAGGSSAAGTDADNGQVTSSSAARSAPGGPELEWAKRQIGKYDSNSDGQLTANEWKAMLVDPSAADTDGDGVITAEEYAAFRAK